MASDGGKVPIEFMISEEHLEKLEVSGTALGLTRDELFARILGRMLEFCLSTGLDIPEIPPRIVRKFWADLSAEVDGILSGPVTN